MAGDEYDDNEVVPLVPTAYTTTNHETRSTVSSSFQIKNVHDAATGNGTEKVAVKNKAMTKQQQSQSRSRYIVICVIVCLLVGLNAKRKNLNGNLNQIAPTISKQHSTGSNGIRKPKMTLRSLRVLREKVAQAHEKFNEQLQTHYGEYYEDIFYTVSESKNKTQGRTSRGSILFESGNPKSNLSKSRFRRKLMMKLLEASAYTYHDDVAATSTATNSSLFRDTKFIWATGGPSTAAGHGNFHNESYTAYIQYALESIFRSVDVELITRNYAMGSASSGSELAMCTKEIYGTDYDVLVWDFGITDGSNYWKQAWYNYRANLLPYQNPIHIAYHAGSRSSPRYTFADTFEQMGMAAIISNDDVVHQAEQAMPDTLGLTDEEINALPEYARNYKCGNQIENGEPYCQKDKFRLGLCPERKYQTSWHPGWKWHALMGYLASYYVLDVLYNAMDELASQLITTDPAALYTALQDEVNQEYDTFRRAKIPEFAKVIANVDDSDLNITHILGGPNYCHTTKLPASIRFQGILTETKTKIGLSGYDKGIGVKTLLKSTYDSDGNAIVRSNGVQPMILSFEENDRQICPISVGIDYKDFFYVGANTGWQQLTLPNQFERNAYNNGVGSSLPKPLLQGYVAMCLALCTNIKCPDGVWGRDVFTENDNLLEIQINEVVVTNYTNIGNAECEFLSHEGGFRFPVDEKENTVTIAVHLNVTGDLNPKSYLRISSWIVW